MNIYQIVIGKIDGNGPSYHSTIDNVALAMSIVLSIETKEYLENSMLHSWTQSRRAWSNAARSKRF